MRDPRNIAITNRFGIVTTNGVVIVSVDLLDEMLADAAEGVTATGVSEVPGSSSIPNPNRVTKP